MQKFVKSAAIFTTALTIAAFVGLAGTPREELATRGLDFTDVVFVKRAGAGDLEAVKLFLAAWMDVNAHRAGGPGSLTGRGFTALHEASLKGRAEMVQFLIENGADVNIEYGPNRTALRSPGSPDSDSRGEGHASSNDTTRRRNDVRAGPCPIRFCLPRHLRHCLPLCPHADE